MDIFKLFFEHDLRLDDLAERTTASEPKVSGTIEEFMKPDPTYSKFYLTGTRLNEEKFGLSCLHQFEKLIDKLEEVFQSGIFYSEGEQNLSLAPLLSTVDVGSAILISKQEIDLTEFDSTKLNITDDSNVGHIKPELRDTLKQDILVLYKEHAHNGYDIHLFSRKNIYESLFYPFRDLVNDTFRFFSINSKRVRSERQFYFETWTLEKPPHGAEEVLPTTQI